MSEIENKEVKTSDAKTKGRGRPAKKEIELNKKIMNVLM